MFEGMKFLSVRFDIFMSPINIIFYFFYYYFPIFFFKPFSKYKLRGLNSFVHILNFIYQRNFFISLCLCCFTSFFEKKFKVKKDLEINLRNEKRDVYLIFYIIYVITLWIYSVKL